MVKSPATVCNEIYIELRKMRKHFEGADVMLRVHPETVKVLKANNARWLTDFEELVGQEHAGQERRHAASGAVRHSGISSVSEVRERPEQLLRPFRFCRARLSLNRALGQGFNQAPTITTQAIRFSSSQSADREGEGPLLRRGMSSPAQSDRPGSES